ncbi:MAG: hypothetical protein ABJD07_12400 [Gemmatimonadaceae bacterium]
MTVAATPVLSAVRTVRKDRFYLGMAAACVAVAVIGFMPTYWIPLMRGSLRVAPIVHLHAFFFFGWTLYLLTQARLVAAGRVMRHRELGVAGVALATGMCFVGVAAAMSSLKHLDAAGFGDAARAFSVVSLTGILLFAVLVATALVNVRKAEVHKRLMLVATISLLQAGVGRLFLTFLAPAGASGGAPPPVFVTVLPGLVTDLLIVAGMVHDRRTRGRVHPAYWYAGAAVLAVQLLRVPLSTTPAWTRVTEMLVAFFP